MSDAGDVTGVGRRGWLRISDLRTHPERWLRIAQCAEYLQVSQDQVWKWHRAGVLVLTAFGPRINRIGRDELLRFEAVSGCRRRRSA